MYGISVVSACKRIFCDKTYSRRRNCFSFMSEMLKLGRGLKTVRIRRCLPRRRRPFGRNRHCGRTFWSPMPDSDSPVPIGPFAWRAAAAERPFRSSFEHLFRSRLNVEFFSIDNNTLGNVLHFFRD